MNDSRRTALVVGAALLIAAGVGAVLFLTHNRAEAPTIPGEGARTSDNIESATITYTDAGFSPASVTVLVGTTVTWKNESSKNLWVYPSDDGEDYCLGQDAPTSFNQCAGVENGGTYSYTFTKPGTYTYKNQENASHTGEVRVSENTINPDAIPQ